MTLQEHINKHYGGNKAAFARANGIKRQQVTPWIKKGYIVVNGVLFSPRRELKETNE